MVEVEVVVGVEVEVVVEVGVVVEVEVVVGVVVGVVVEVGMRIRFTASGDLWARAQDYAKATNRTSSELICEALDQIMARYPTKRNGHHATEIDIDALCMKIAKIIGLRYPQVPSMGNGNLPQNTT